MPDPHVLREHRWLKIFAPLFNDPNLLHFNRRSIATGVFCGMMGAFVPLPVQMFVAVILAIFLRGNLAVAVGFTWFSNPLTYIPLYYFCFLVGEFIVGAPTDAAGNPIPVNMEKLINDIFSGELSNLAEFFVTNGSQLLLGCLLVGLVSGGTGYLMVSYLWRLHVLKHWKLRRESRKDKSAIKASSNK